VKGYRDYKSAEDRDLWLRLLPLTDFFRIRENLLKYRVHTDGVSKRNYAQQKAHSLLAILNYDVKKRMGVDLYEEHYTLLEHYQKTFTIYALEQEKIHQKVAIFKSKIRDDNWFRKCYGFFILLINWKIVKHLRWHHLDDRKLINKSILQVEVYLEQ